MSDIWAKVLFMRFEWLIKIIDKLYLLLSICIISNFAFIILLLNSLMSHSPEKTQTQIEN